MDTFVHATQTPPASPPVSVFVSPTDEVSDSRKLDVDKDIPLPLYQGRFGKPYALEAFELSKHQTVPHDQSMLTKLEAIESFVFKEMATIGKTDKQSYKNYLKSFAKEMNIHDTDAITRVNKIYTAMAVKLLERNNFPALTELRKHFA